MAHGSREPASAAPEPGECADAYSLLRLNNDILVLKERVQGALATHRADEFSAEVNTSLASLMRDLDAGAESVRERPGDVAPHPPGGGGYTELHSGFAPGAHRRDSEPGAGGRLAGRPTQARRIKSVVPV